MDERGLQLLTKITFPIPSVPPLKVTDCSFIQLKYFSLYNILINKTCSQTRVTLRGCSICHAFDVYHYHVMSQSALLLYMCMPLLVSVAYYNSCFAESLLAICLGYMLKLSGVIT